MTENHSTAEDISAEERLAALLPTLPDYLLEVIQHPKALPFPVLERSQLRIGYVPAIMPGKWFTRWHERYGDRVQLAEMPLNTDSGLTMLDKPLGLGEETRAAEPLMHMCILRPDKEPESQDKDRYHSIRLYEELPVVVLPKDHVLTVLDEVPVEELAEEFLMHEPEDFPAWAEVSEEYRAANPRRVPEYRHDKDAIELVAAGVGLYIVPMSIARYYHRKDLTYRPVTGLETYPVNLVWKRRPKEDPRTEEEETIIQDFIGIVRGRTATSDRGSETKQARAERIAAEKARDKAKKRAANARREAKDRKAANARKNGNARQHARQSAANAQARRAADKKARKAKKRAS